MAGFAVFTRALQINPDEPPWVFCADRERALEAGFDVFLVDILELARALDRCKRHAAANA